jgi:hypothetical protein
LRSTPRFGFPRVLNALNLELNLLALFEAALVPASWRVVLHCSRRMPLLHSALLVVRVGVLCCIVAGEDPQPPLAARSVGAWPGALVLADSRMITIVY